MWEILMRFYTQRTEASIDTVLFTQLSSLRIGAGVGTRISTLLMHHAVRTRMSWTYKTNDFQTHPSSKHELHKAKTTGTQPTYYHDFTHDIFFAGRVYTGNYWDIMRCSPQKWSVLHSAGLPPACTHCLEYSAMVLHRQKLPEMLQWHKSFMQTWMKESMDTRPLHSLNTWLEKTWRQNVCREREATNSLV